MGKYVTREGFKKRTFTELEDYYTKLLRSIFGDTLDLQAQQAEGAFLDMLASTEAEVWDALQDTYTANDLRNAVGVALDNNVGALLGILRQDATKGQIPNVSLIGTEGTVVPAGRKVRNTTNVEADRRIFLTDVDTTITAAVANFVRYDIPTGAPSIELDSVTYVAPTSTSKLSNATALGTQVAGDGYLYSIEQIDDDVFLNVHLGTGSDTGSSSFEIGAVSGPTIEAFGSPCDVTAEVEGYVDAPEGFISEIVTGVSGWSDVESFYPKTIGTGTGVELDPEYRKRLEFGVESSGLATEQAIRRVVLNDVAEVLTCAVRSNRTMVAFPAPPPTNGQAPKSFQVYVDGIPELPDPNNPTAAQQALGEAIFKAAGAGIEPFGTEGPIYVEDDDGEPQEVYYSIIQAVEMEARVRREKYEEFNPYPADGDDLIKAGVAQYTREMWVINKDVIPSRLIPPVYTSTTGVGSVIVEVREKGSGDPWSTDTIPIDSTSIATLAEADITVEDL